MRWTLNSLYLKTNDCFKFHFNRYAAISILLILMGTGWMYAIPATKTFYLGCIIWWTLFVVTLLWYVVGAYVVKRYKETLISIVVPSIYLCYVDLIALRARVWHINEATSLEIFPIDDLPIEEITFFFITNTIISIGAAAFDKSKAVIDTYCREPHALGSNIGPFRRFWGYVKMMTQGFVCNEQNLNSTVIEDLETCIVVLDKASKSFSLAANCFSSG